MYKQLIIQRNIDRVWCDGIFFVGLSFTCSHTLRFPNRTKTHNAPENGIYCLHLFPICFYNSAFISVYQALDWKCVSVLSIDGMCGEKTIAIANFFSPYFRLFEFRKPSNTIHIMGKLLKILIDSTVQSRRKQIHERRWERIEWQTSAYYAKKICYFWCMFRDSLPKP